MILTNISGVTRLVGGWQKSLTIKEQHRVFSVVNGGTFSIPDYLIDNTIVQALLNSGDFDLTAYGTGYHSFALNREIHPDLIPFTPTVPGDWLTTPTTVQEALDETGARLP